MVKKFLSFVVISEPNVPFTQEEENTIINFIKNGGGAFL